VPSQRPALLPERLARTLMLAAALALPLQGPQAQAVERPGGPPHEGNTPRLPALGESAAEDFAVGAERRLGDEVMTVIRRDPAYLDDPQLLQYLQSLWQPLVAAARTRGDIDVDTASQFAWEAFLVRDRSVNAFALPGGFVGVHLGLIAMTRTRDQLASVLAHELTHVTQRHIARGLAVQQRQTLLSVVGMILALLAASRADNADLAQAAVMGGQAAALQGQLNFSRDMEREADRIGFALLAGAGFDAAGMSAMFELMDRTNRFNDSNAYPYLRSHPLTQERQSEARMRLQGQPLPATAASPALHALMAARASVLMDPSVASLHRLQQLPLAGEGEPQGAATQLAALYAAAMAASLLNEHALAAQRIAQAQALLAAPNAPQPELEHVFAMLRAEAALAAGDAAAALQQLGTLRQAQQGAPRADAAAQRPLLLLQAQAALRAPPPQRAAALREATERLQTWVAQHPQDATGWLLLGNCAQAQGQRLRALRAQAEERALLGDLTGALDRLRSGRELARSGAAGQDFIEASIIEVRWRELQAQRRALLAERRGRPGERAPAEDPDAQP
jgi:predicted Zn-dependent protease